VNAPDMPAQMILETRLVSMAFGPTTFARAVEEDLITPIVDGGEHQLNG